MRIDVRGFETIDVVLIEGCLDLATTGRLRAVLNGRLAEGRADLVVDLWRVRLLDAGAVGMLVAVAGRTERGGGRLRAVGARGLVLEVLQIVGVDHRLRAYDQPEQIVAEKEEVEPGIGSAAETEPRSTGVARWPGGRDLTTHALLAAVAQLPDGSEERGDLRSQAIEDNIEFATRLARRFRDRGEPLEDLAQVAMVGLVNAVDGYDPRRGCEFAGYATPTIVGEVRRYFRDKGWRIKVPRRLQERRLQVNRAKVELSQTLAASPTVTDIASHLRLDEAEVMEAIEVSRLYSPASLSVPAGPDAELGLADPPGEDDPGIEAVDNRQSVMPLLATLPEREQRILTMRFFGNMTQSQIANQLGISQMHVSRLLSQTLQKLRTALVEA